MPRPGGNPDIREVSKKSTGPTSELGKFRVSLNAYKGHDSNTYRNRRIPQEVRDTYAWYKALSTGERKFIFEMKGIYEVLKGNYHNNKELSKKILNGKQLDPIELKQFELLVNILEKLQKMEYGEKHININADIKDIRDAMFQ